jgi:hypothetical protein
VPLGAAPWAAPLGLTGAVIELDLAAAGGACEASTVLSEGSTLRTTLGTAMGAALGVDNVEGTALGGVDWGGNTAVGAARTRSDARGREGRGGTSVGTAGAKGWYSARNVARGDTKGDIAGGNASVGTARTEGRGSATAGTNRLTGDRTHRYKKLT